MQDIKTDTFIAVCRYRNFTRAAEALGLTQPAVSRQMKSLEEYYGVPLFRYEGKKLFLTTAGETLYRYVQVSKSDERRLQKKLKEQTDNILRLGLTPTPGGFMLPSILPEYLKEYPTPKTHLIIQNTGSLLEKLDRDEIDLAIVEGNFSKKAYECLLFSKQNFVPVCASWQTVPGSSLEALLPFPLILREPGSGNREIVEYSLKRQNLSPADFAATIETNSIHMQKALVRQGCGIAFLFQAAIEKETDFRVIPTDGFPMQHEINIVWRKNSLFQEEYLRLAEYFAGKLASS